jgi:hypothetical protein
MSRISTDCTVDAPGRAPFVDQPLQLGFDLLAAA